MNNRSFCKRLGLQDALAVRAFMQNWAEQDRSPGFLWTPEEVVAELHQGLSWGAGVAGKVSCLLMARTPGDAAEMIFLATSAEFRRQGLAKKVFAAARQDLGVRPWWLEVHEHNLPARSLYLSLGFREDGHRPRYYRDGGDAILMSFSAE